MLLDIAKHIGTHNTVNGRANGRMMDYEYIPQPADGDDMTWQTQDGTLNMAALAKAVRDLQNHVYGLQAEIVTLRERLDAWEGDS